MLQTLTIQFKILYRQRQVQIMLKIVLFSALFFVLYAQLSTGIQNIPWEEVKKYWVEQFGLHNVLLIAAALLLMPLNWALETEKWRCLLRPALSISFSKGFRGVLAGLTVSLFTPNRIGEYGGRVLMVNSEHRLHAVFATIMGSAAQWLALLGGGLIGLSYLLYRQLPPQDFHLYAQVLFLLGICLLLFFVFGYYNLNIFVSNALKFRLTAAWARSFQKHLQLEYSNANLNKALLFSLMRYAVYSIQYLFILYSFGFECGILEGLSAISFVFLLQTGLPIPTSMGLLARGSIALWVFGWLMKGMPEADLTLRTAVLASTFLLWFINVIVPAMLGSFWIIGRTFQEK